MKTTIFSTHKFEEPYIIKANNGKHQLKLLENRLTEDTAILANGSKTVSLFTGDDGSANVLKKLFTFGIRNIALRSAGFNHVDLAKATELGIKVARVPAYSPYAIAEHTLALILALNRKLIKAHNRVREQNFSLNGLTGFDLNGKTVGVICTGKIGAVLVKILHGFGCKILAQDVVEDKNLIDKYRVRYVDCESLCKQADIITLHVPLTTSTRHLINAKHINLMKNGVMLINTSRGGLVNTKDVITGLKSRKIGYFGMDVYEEEEGLFFEDHSDDILLDDVIARLMTFNNVLITSHQAFLTETALTAGFLTSTFFFIGLTTDFFAAAFATGFAAFLTTIAFLGAFFIIFTAFFTVFLTTAFLGTGFLAAGFLTTTFLAAGFFATGFFAATFLGATFLAGPAFLTGLTVFFAAGLAAFFFVAIQLSFFKYVHF